MDDNHEADHLSRGEVAKDAIQASAEATVTTVGEVTTIITTAVRDVAGAVGGLATELFAIQDASRKALHEHATPLEAVPSEEPPADAPADDGTDDPAGGGPPTV